MGYNHFRYARRIDADVIGLYHDDLTQLATLSKATANKTIMCGPPLTADIFELKANSIDAYPFLRLNGNSSIYAMAKNQHDFGVNNVLAGRLKLGGDNLGGSFHLKETTTPGAVADFGAIYTKADNHLYFQDGAGAEHDMGSP